MRTYIHAYRPGTLASNNIMPKKKKKSWTNQWTKAQGPERIPRISVINDLSLLSIWRKSAPFSNET